MAPWLWMAQTPQQPSVFQALLPFLIILGIFYVLVILPQSRAEKRHREMLASLKKGDRVVTAGGILGEVTRVEEKTVNLRIARDVVVKVEKTAIKARIHPADTGKTGS